MAEPTTTVTLASGEKTTVPESVAPVLAERDAFAVLAGWDFEFWGEHRIHWSFERVKKECVERQHEDADSPQPERCDGSGYIDQHYGTGQKTARVACPGCSNCQPERYSVEELSERLTTAAVVTVAEHAMFVVTSEVTRLDARAGIEAALSAAFPDQQPVEDCERCKGSGVELRQGNGEWISDPCPDCGGSGHDAIPGPTGEPISQGPCRTCEGTGQPEQEGEAGCGWCHGEGAITDPSGRLGADCPRCEGRTWLLCERPNHPLHDPQEGEAGDWPGVCDADQSFNEWELGCIRTFAARQLDALSPPEAESVVGERWLAFLNKAAHAAHRLASADPAPAQHPTGLSEEVRGQLAELADKIANDIEPDWPHAEEMRRDVRLLRQLADQQPVEETVTCECCEKRLPSECAATGIEGESLCGACVAALEAPIVRAAFTVVNQAGRVDRADLADSISRLRTLLNDAYSGAPTSRGGTDRG